MAAACVTAMPAVFGAFCGVSDGYSVPPLLFEALSSKGRDCRAPGCLLHLGCKHHSRGLARTWSGESRVLTRLLAPLQRLAEWCLSYCQDQDSLARSAQSAISTAHTSTKLDLDAGPAKGIQHQVRLMVAPAQREHRMCHICSALCAPSSS